LHTALRRLFLTDRNDTGAGQKDCRKKSPPHCSILVKLDITVLDLTRLLPGATATDWLARNGATVIKIEQPGDGDYARSLAPEIFAATNSGKKSICLNLKDPRGRELLLQLASTADVLIEGFRPGAMARLGLGFDELHTVNSRLIYASLTGYGQTGPYADLAGHDVNYLALGGVLGLSLPTIPGVQIADLAAGSMQAVIAILFALVERGNTGKGRYLDVSMLAGVESLLTVPLALHRGSGREPQAGNEILSGRYACYNVYEAGDGRWLAVGALEPKFWAELCRRIGCEDLIPLQFASGETRRQVKERVAAIFRTRTAAEWFEALRAFDCCVTPVRTISEVAAELPHPANAAPPPGLGEHTRAILSGCGISDSELDHLEREGVIQ
jgi:crotonobetainyl-CoA:carnitine CoA-transferase CaiB-like acyl-CoA transferase